MNNDNLYISKLSIPLDKTQREVDMIVVDKDTMETYLFEVKFSKDSYESNFTHLVNEEFMNYITDNFGNVKNKYLLYNGENGYAKGVNHINVEDFFEIIHEQKDNWKEAIAELNELSKEQELTLKTRTPLNDVVKDCEGRKLPPQGGGPLGGDEPCQ